MRKLTKEEFIEKARKVHGDKYDYSKVEYVNNKTKVCIICSKHGEFWQRPNDLLNGMGCPKCGGTKKLTNDEFICKATYVHNSYFSYEKCIYTGSGNKVLVTCPIHGDFEVKANNHLSGVNCKLCENEGVRHKINKLEQVNKSTATYDTLMFIEKCKEIHGNKYTYEETIYNGNSKKVLVTCPIHGYFEITPNHILSGRGCSKCAKNYKYSTEEIIEKFKTIHGDKYDYSKVKYTKTHDNVIIICSKHGEFKMSPSNHLKGEGCPICKSSNLEKEIKLMLDNNSLNYYFRYRKLKFLNGMELDFYLPEYKIAIECQGIQHFMPVMFFGGEKAYEELKVRDNEKMKKCLANGIKILYYSNLNMDYPYMVYKTPEEILKLIIK